MGPRACVLWWEPWLSACGFGPWLLLPDRRPVFGHLFLSNWYLLELQFLSVELARIEGTETALFSWGHFWGDRDGPVLCFVEGHVPHSWADRKAGGPRGQPPSARGLGGTGSVA